MEPAAISQVDTELEIIVSTILGADPDGTRTALARRACSATLSTNSTTASAQAAIR
jgi:hypothetical protein